MYFNKYRKCSVTLTTLLDAHRLRVCEWTFIVNSTEEERENFCKGLDGKPLFSALYSLYTVTLNELKAVQKVTARAGQSAVVNDLSGINDL
jgi:hypothetical protein